MRAKIHLLLLKLKQTVESLGETIVKKIGLEKGKKRGRDFGVKTKGRMGSTIIRMEKIVKRFPGVLANDHIDFEVKRGEIHALLGENGAGKTTIMKILYGFSRPDNGSIYIKGRRVILRSPRDAIDLGIGMVHQHFMLIPAFTVTQNVLLGLESSKGILLDVPKAEKTISELSKKYGLKVNSHDKIWQLSVGEQQRVEIIKVLYRGADILILDEPTSVLTPLEVEDLFRTLRSMVEEGLTIIFITHKLNEVMAVSDRVTVLRDGKVISTLETSKTDKRKLAKLMVGREVMFKLAKPPVEVSDSVLKVEKLCALSDKGLPALKDVSFSVFKREILGIAGVSGNGQSELAEVITGLRKATKGKVIISERDITNRSPKEIIEQGVGHIPEDRIGTGLSLDLTLAENLILEVHSKPPFAKGLLLDSQEIGQYAGKLISEFDIKAPSKDVPARFLSGGNLQKLILARELSRDPKLLIAVQPTRGLDVGATEYIRSILLKWREKGTGILLISEDLDEILSISDRIAVMYDGKIVGIATAEKANIEEIGLMMGGITD